MYELFMNFENPTESFTGKRESVQGFSVCGKHGFVLFHTGICAVYELEARNEKALAIAKLGSYNRGEPDNRYTNHANDAMFGGTLPGDTLPLLYVTAGNSGEADERGFIACCAVERLRLEGSKLSCETVQRIYYKDEGEYKNGFTRPRWGWFASLVDLKAGRYVTLSARHRTTKAFAHLPNEYIITSFKLPDPTSGDVTLTPRDIIDQFTLPFDVFFTQGGTLRDGKIYYTFGCGCEDYPNELRVIDLEKREYILAEPIADGAFPELARDEVECCGFYGDRMLINTQSGKLYARVGDDPT